MALVLKREEVDRRCKTIPLEVMRVRRRRMMLFFMARLLKEGWAFNYRAGEVWINGRSLSYSHVRRGWWYYAGGKFRLLPNLRAVMVTLKRELKKEGVA